MRDTAEIFGFTFDIQMRYLVYMRYLWSVAMKLKFDRCAIIIISICRAPPPLKVLATSLYIKRFSSHSKPYPRFIQKDKTRMGYTKRFSSHSKPYPRFIQKDKTRMGYIKRFSSHSKSHPRFIQKDKTRMGYIKRFSSHSKPYLRFTQKDKTRICSKIRELCF